jgi:tetratricopeptide (TPR) repeat protein
VIGTYRPVDVILTESPLKTVKQDLIVHQLCQEVVLDRLEEIDVAAYLTDIAEVERAESAPADALDGHRGSDDQVESLAGLIHRRSDGIPLFMTAMLDHLIQKNVVAPGDHRWTMRRPWEHVDPVPETLKQMLQVQIDDLRDPDRELLLCASVAGQRFTNWSAAILLGTDAADTERRCGALCERQQVLKWVGARELPDGSVTAEYEFKHALYREVLYRRLQPNRRASLHLRLATEMEMLPAIGDPDAGASELASHFEEGREFGRAVPYLIGAASRATRRYAPADAARLLEHARQLLPKVAADRRSEAESQVFQRLGDTYYALGDVVRSASSYQAAAAHAAEAGRPAVEMEALLRQAHPTAILDPDRAINVCARAAEIAKQHGDVVAEARARLLAAGWRILLDGRRREDSETCASAMKTLRGQGAGDVTPHEYVLYANVQFLQGQYAEACDHAEAALGNLSSTDGLWERVAGLTAKAVGLLHLGRFGEAHGTLTTGLELARKNGNAIWDGIVSSVLASLHVQAFDFEGVRTLSKSLLEAGPSPTLLPVRLQMAPQRGYAELMLGEPWVSPPVRCGTSKKCSIAGMSGPACCGIGGCSRASGLRRHAWPRATSHRQASRPPSSWTTRRR